MSRPVSRRTSPPLFPPAGTATTLTRTRISGPPSSSQATQTEGRWVSQSVRSPICDIYFVISHHRQSRWYEEGPLKGPGVDRVGSRMMLVDLTTHDPDLLASN